MTTPKTELAVAALRNGTVIDHIPSGVLFKCVKILGIEGINTQLTIGNNLASSRMGAKGIIKVADIEFSDDTLSRIALLAPDARVNVIRDYQVVDKRPVVLPDTIVGIVRCDNPKCITNNEPMTTRFTVIGPGRTSIRCHYCGRAVDNDKATII